MLALTRKVNQRIRLNDVWLEVMKIDRPVCQIKLTFADGVERLFWLDSMFIEDMEVFIQAEVRSDYQVKLRFEAPMDVGIMREELIN